jgi:hypothetical protein
MRQDLQEDTMEERIEAAERAASSAEREAFFDWLDGVITQNAAESSKDRVWR